MPGSVSSVNLVTVCRTGGMEAWLSLQVGHHVETSGQLRDGVIVTTALANILPERFYNLRYIQLFNQNLEILLNQLVCKKNLQAGR